MRSCLRIGKSRGRDRAGDMEDSLASHDRRTERIIVQQVSLEEFKVVGSSVELGQVSVLVVPYMHRDIHAAKPISK